MRNHDEDQWNRIEAITEDDDVDVDWEGAQNRFLRHLKINIKLPVQVTGKEDFQWEEFYVIGPGDQHEYKELKKTQPSYTDKYDLLEISQDGDSPWVMCQGEDLAAHVRRRRMSKEFVLGLSELRTVDDKSSAHKLLDDYAVWFWNSR